MASIQGIYLALFGRPADPAGIAYYNGVTNNGADLSGIGNLSGQKEYVDRFAGMGSSQIVQSIYQSLFGRAGEQAGIDFWVGRLASGALSINNIAIAILDGATGTDKLTLDAKIAAADLFTSHLDLPAEQKAYDASTVGRARDYIATIDAAHPGTVSGVDALIAQNQTSAGQSPASGVDAGGGGGVSTPVKGVSLTVLDADHVAPSSADPAYKTTIADDVIRVSDTYHSVGTIDGGDGHDRLIISTDGNVTPGAASIANIEKLEIATSANSGTIDLTNVQNLQEIWRDADAHDIRISGIGKSVTTIGMQGTFEDLAKYSLTDPTGTADAITLALKDATANRSEVWLDGFEHITINVDGDSKVAVQAYDLESLTITGKGDLNFYYVDDIFRPTDRPRTIDASQHEGSTHLSLNELRGSVDFIGGTGDDWITAYGANQTLTGGGGTNTFTIFSGGGLEGMSVVTDFNPLKDYLAVNDFLDTAITLESFLPFQRAEIVQQGSFEEAVAFVGTLTKTIAKETTIAFAYGNDTYVYTDRGHDGLTANDSIVKIAGVNTSIDPHHLLLGSI